MAGPGLPVNVDTTYADSGGDASVKAHQQHHDAAHGIVNKFDTASPGAVGCVPTWNGTVYAPAQQALNVKGYGALGDGTTNDSAAIISALSAARATGSPLLFPPGVYATTAQHYDPTGVIISGYGATVKLLAGQTLSGGGLFQPTNGFTMLGLTVDLNKANTTDPGVATSGMAIYLFNAVSWSGLVIRDVTVKNGFQAGIRVGTGTTAGDPLNLPTTPGVIDNATVTGCKWGLMTAQVGDLTVANCNFSSNSQDGVNDSGSLRGRFIGNSCCSNGNSGISTLYSYGFLSSTNTCSLNGVSGLVVGGGSVSRVNSNHFVLTGNVCRGNGSGGINVDTTVTGSPSVVQPTYGSVVGNLCDLNVDAGIIINNSTRVAVTGNTCTGNLTGISGQSAECVFVGNVCHGNLDYGINVPSNTSGSNAYTIANNYCGGNGIAAYHWDSTASNAPVQLSGVGVPALAAPLGSTYLRTDGGAGTTLYVKETNQASTVWAAK